MAAADEAEVEAAAIAPEEELELEPDADDPDPEAETAPETILPVPQGIAGPSGCRALGGVVTAPFVSAMANRVVHVGSWPLWVNWKK